MRESERGEFSVRLLWEFSLFFKFSDLLVVLFSAWDEHPSCFEGFHPSSSAVAYFLLYLTVVSSCPGMSAGLLVCFQILPECSAFRVLATINR